jgi:two-component system sensor histidine kinase YesM
VYDTENTVFTDQIPGEKQIMLLVHGGRPFLSLRMRFMVLFILLITIPIVVSGTFTYTKYSSNVERNAENYTRQIVEQIGINMDRYIDEIDRLTLAPYYDPVVMSILKSHSGPYRSDTFLSAESKQKITLFISSMSYDRTEIQNIVMFTNDGGLYNDSEVSVKKYWGPEEQAWMDIVYAEKGGIAILPPHTVDYYTSGPKRVLSLARLVREPFTHRPLGIVKVDFTPGSFSKLFETEHFKNGINLYIYDKGNHPIVPDQPAAIANIDSPHYVSASSSSKHLRLSGRIPVKGLKREANELTRFTLIITVLSLAAAYLLSIVASNRLVKPIHHLKRKMALVQQGFFKEQAVVTTHDEIGQLTEGFNEMVREIDRLVLEVYETKIRERDAELAVLQNQMNPHFLYNTLESVNMMAVKAGNFGISNVVSNLGNLLRYTVDNHQRFILLREEIRFVESYLSIQELRSGGKLRIELYIGPSLNSAIVPKLIVQPVIENVIEHGMLGADLVTIRITGKMEREDLILTIEDDGAGMDEQAIKRIEKRMYSPREENPAKEEYGQKTRGYALRNVHQRVRLLYGSPYGLSIVNKKGPGACFVIRLPFQWEE